MSAAGRSAFRSREEYKKAKELEEARKAGTAAPEVDEEGNDINPHIPQYIANAPWYYKAEGPTLKHQRSQSAADRKFDGLGKWYSRGQKTGPAVSKYRKGACENCGSMTHKRKDCFERPRARGAKWTGQDIAQDDAIEEVNLNWEGKRDKWNGFDPRSYRDVEERYAKIEAERKRIRAEQLDADLRAGKPLRKEDDDDSSDDEQTRDADDTKHRDSRDVVIQQTDQANPTTARNLRIREDTAKYLRNLDVNSAYYDPKTRSMRADPTPHMNPDDKDYAGDNFVRRSGDVQKLGQMELHSLRAAESGQELPHLQAEPTAAENVFKDFATRKGAIEKKHRDEIFRRYGGQEHTRIDSALASVQQCEVYTEFTRDGKPINDTDVARPLSRYPEDILVKNHTAVWGSFYKDGDWGYACCHQLSRNAYCTGEAGKQAAVDVEREMEAKTAVAKRARVPLVKGKLSTDTKDPNSHGAASYGAAGTSTEFKDDGNGRDEQRDKGADVKRRKLDHALQKLDSATNAFEPDDRRRKYNSGAGNFRELSEEDMEAYRLRKQSSEDPLAGRRPDAHR